MAGLRPPEARKPEARGIGREGRVGQQEIGEDFGEWEQRGDVGVYQEQMMHRHVSRE